MLAAAVQAQDSAPQSVLAVLVVKDGVPWLRRALASLARQTHPRVGVLAVDNGSTDGSAELLERLLGKKRVLRTGRNVGHPAAVQRALALPAVRKADFVLLLHDDVALGADAVAHLVDAAQRFEGAGIVGAKVLDWEEPDVLREVGFAADRFGYPYSPLEEDEIDQGQYDAPREVLFVSAAAMLISRAALARTAGPDERLRPAHADLDLCWRARLAGLRVLVAPDAVAFHRGAGTLEERPGSDVAGDRYHVERAGLASLLKNYRAVTLLWLLPMYLAQTAVRAVSQIVTRHLDEALAILRAWGWNLLHLPGTVRRRVRAQATRRVGDREIHGFMTPAAARLRRWAQQASALVAARAGAIEPEEEPERPPLVRRVGTIVSDHPVAVALAVAVFLVVVGFRGVLFVPRIEGGALPTFPVRLGEFFHEFASPWRSTGLGGPGGGSPALVALGTASVVTFADPQLLARLLIALGPVAAAASCFGAVRRVVKERRAATLAAAAYALSGLVLWASSDGRVAVLVLLVGMPWLTIRLGSAFDARERPSPWRWIVGSALLLALVGAFFPAVWIAASLALFPAFLSARGGASRGLVLVGASTLLAAALVFPFTFQLASAGGGTSLDAAGRPDFALLLRLAPGGAPGTWIPALFLPLAGVLAFTAGGDRDPTWAGRAMATAALGIPLAWLAAAGYLPALVANPVAFLAPVAFALSLLVGLGVASGLAGVRRTAFGARQVATVGLGLVIAGGVVLQAFQVLLGQWAVGESSTPAAWPVVSRANAGTEFRVLWLGPPDGGRFPSPGGQPEGVIEAGAASVAFGVTGREGRSALAVGEPLGAPATDAVRRAVSSILTGEVRHGGAILSPFGVRFVVSGEGDLPPAATARLDDQVDLDLIQRVGGLWVWRNADALPVASVLPGPDPAAAARSTDLLAATALDPEAARSLDPTSGPGWRGTAEEGQGVVFAATEFDPSWRLEAGGRTARPFAAFGWATGFDVDAGGQVLVRFDAGVGRPLELAALVAMWVAALWVVGRTPGPRRRAHRRGPDLRSTVDRGEPSRSRVPEGSSR